MNYSIVFEGFSRVRLRNQKKTLKSVILEIIGPVSWIAVRFAGSAALGIQVYMYSAHLEIKDEKS